MAFNVLQALQALLGGHQGLGQAPTPAPSKRAGLMVTPNHYQGTDTGFLHPQAAGLPGINPNQKQPAYAGGIDIRQQNIPWNSLPPSPNNTVYNHPLPVWRVITPPPFHPMVQGSTVPFGTGMATAATPPQMVNVPWSSQQVPYSQSLNPPKGY